jgi:uncharacterized protein (DUF433 family)
MTRFDRITCNPAVLNGQPTLRGMRLTVRRVVEALALYPNWDDLRAEYPELEPEDIRRTSGEHPEDIRRTFGGHSAGA